jgi:hypothetical protein
VNGLALTDAILKLQAVGSAATVTFTGWEMTAAELICHGENELTLHRWDLVGSDATSLALLSRTELLEHSWKAFDRMDIFDAPDRPGERPGAGPRALLELWGRDPDRKFQCNARRLGHSFTNFQGPATTSDNHEIEIEIHRGQHFPGSE